MQQNKFRQKETRISAFFKSDWKADTDSFSEEIIPLSSPHKHLQRATPHSATRCQQRYTAGAVESSGTPGRSCALGLECWKSPEHPHHFPKPSTPPHPPVRPLPKPALISFLTSWSPRGRCWCQTWWSSPLVSVQGWVGGDRAIAVNRQS